jgi:2-keto-4-pentenoate hydratase
MPRQTIDFNSPDPSSSQSIFPPANNENEEVIQGHKDAVKESTKESQKTIDKFDNLVQLSQAKLFETSTIFPFDLFPTKVIIDLNKVSIVNKLFWGSQTIHSVFIADVTDVLVHTSFFFATLEIVDAGFIENSIKIERLNISDARRARRIIQGLVIAKKQDIDLSKLDIPDLVSKLETLGESKG